jgi:hypothetical protein
MGLDATLHKTRRDWLAATIRGERPGWPAASIGSTGDMFAAAETEGVATLIDQAIRAPGPEWDLPQKARDVFAGATRQAQSLEMLRHQEIVRVLRVLKAAGIPALALKGTALAYNVYPLPWLRPRIDTDLLVPDSEAVECCKPLLAGLDYAASPAAADPTACKLAFNHAVESGIGHRIETHWRLSCSPLFADRFRFEELRADAVALPALGPDARGLCNVHALLHACMQRVCRLPLAGGERLIGLYDIHLLVKRCSDPDIDRLCDIAIQRGLAGSCWDGLRTAVAVFGTPVLDRLLVALELAAKDERFDIRKARKRWYQRWQDLRALPQGQRPVWLWDRLFKGGRHREDR